mgnify:CR=1 FL=1
MKKICSFCAVTIVLLALIIGINAHAENFSYSDDFESITAEDLPAYNEIVTVHDISAKCFSSDEKKQQFMQRDGFAYTFSDVYKGTNGVDYAAVAGDFPQSGMGKAIVLYSDIVGTPYLQLNAAPSDGEIYSLKSFKTRMMAAAASDTAPSGDYSQRANMGIRFMVSDDGNSYYEIALASNNQTEFPGAPTKTDVISAVSPYFRIVKDGQTTVARSPRGTWNMRAGYPVDLEVNINGSVISWTFKYGNHYGQALEWSSSYDDAAMTESTAVPLALFNRCVRAGGQPNGTWAVFGSLSAEFEEIKEPENIVYLVAADGKKTDENGIITLREKLPVSKICAPSLHETTIEIALSEDGTNFINKTAEFDRNGCWLNNDDNKYRYVKFDDAQEDITVLSSAVDCGTVIVDIDDSVEFIGYVRSFPQSEELAWEMSDADTASVSGGSGAGREKAVYALRRRAREGRADAAAERAGGSADAG